MQNILFYERVVKNEFKKRKERNFEKFYDKQGLTVIALHQLNSS